MEGIYACEVHIGQSIPIREVEGLAPNIRYRTLETPSGHGANARVHKRHAPRLRRGPMNIDCVGRQVECYITCMKMVVGKVLLDEVPLVPETNDEVVDAKRRE